MHTKGISMSFLNSFYEGMPSEISPDAMIANKAVAHSLRMFYDACLSERFSPDQAFALTMGMFENIMSNDERMEDDCK